MIEENKIKERDNRKRDHRGETLIRGIRGKNKEVG
jgi:hypothetical protein